MSEFAEIFSKGFNFTFENKTEIDKVRTVNYKIMDFHYNNYISNPHQNSIYSKKQLFNYCNKIIEQINEISALKEIKRIYIVFATQSPLPFEIGKQLNDRMAKEVIICHYQNDSCVPYEWGIALNGKNTEKYIDLKEV